VTAWQSGATPTLTYAPGFSVKLDQVIGDCDLQAQAKQIVAGQFVTCLRTTSQTIAPQAGTLITVHQ